MTTGDKPIARRSAPTHRWMRRLTAVASCWTVFAPTLVLAHGGGDVSDLVPPVVTAGLLGFACYWLVMLFPSVTRNGTGSSRPLAALSPEKDHAIRIKRKPRLRVVEAGSQLEAEAPVGKKAADG